MYLCVSIAPAPAPRKRRNSRQKNNAATTARTCLQVRELQAAALRTRCELSMRRGDPPSVKTCFCLTGECQANRNTVVHDRLPLVAGEERLDLGDGLQDSLLGLALDGLYISIRPRFLVQEGEDVVEGPRPALAARHEPLVIEDRLQIEGGSLTPKRVT